MQQGAEPKWKEEIETILRDRYQGDELLAHLKQVNAILDFANEVEVPSGDAGVIVALILKWASDELYPMAAVYSGFQLGVAYERYQNAD